MKPPIQSREWLLLLPFLLIGGLALYWGRLEQSGGAGALYATDFRVEDAPGYWREKGFSHRVTVKLWHRWPRPRNWGQWNGSWKTLDPLDPDFQPNLGAGNASDFVMMGGTLAVDENGRARAWPRAKSWHPTQRAFENDQWVLRHLVKLSEVPVAAGALTFHGLYRIGGEGKIAVTRQVREAGQMMPMASDQTPGAQIDEADATPFFPVGAPGTAGASSGQDKCQIGLIVRDLTFAASKNSAQKAGAAAPEIKIYDVTLHDQSGKIYRPPARGIKRIGGRSFVYNRAFGPGQTKYAVSLWMNRSLKTPDKLWMRGKLSLDERWPLTFDLPLPPRSGRIVKANASINYSCPMVRGGAPVGAK